MEFRSLLCLEAATLVLLSGRVQCNVREDSGPNSLPCLVRSCTRLIIQKMLPFCQQAVRDDLRRQDDAVVHNMHCVTSTPLSIMLSTSQVRPPNIRWFPAMSAYFGQLYQSSKLLPRSPLPGSRAPRRTLGGIRSHTFQKPNRHQVASARENSFCDMSHSKTLF